MTTVKSLVDILGDIYNNKVLESSNSIKFKDTYCEGLAEILEVCFLNVRPPLVVDFSEELQRVDALFREFQAKYDVAKAMTPDFFRVSVYDRLIQSGFSKHWVDTLYNRLKWRKKYRGLGIGFTDDLYYGDDDSRPE
jgi:hypothetical protein